MESASQVQEKLLAADAGNPLTDTLLDLETPDFSLEGDRDLAITLRIALALMGLSFSFLSLIPSLFVFFLLSPPLGWYIPFSYTFLLGTVSAPFVGLATMVLAVCTPIPHTPLGMPRKSGFWEAFIFDVLKPILLNILVLLGSLCGWLLCLVVLGWLGL